MRILFENLKTNHRYIINILRYAVMFTHCTIQSNSILTIDAFFFLPELFYYNITIIEWMFSACRYKDIQLKKKKQRNDKPTWTFIFKRRMDLNCFFPTDHQSYLRSTTGNIFHQIYTLGVCMCVCSLRTCWS